MKIRLILENDYGYTHENSVEIEVDSIPRVGEEVWIDDVSELFEKAFRTEDYDNYVFHCSEMSVIGNDYFVVCKVIHNYTIKDFGTYIILVNDYNAYLNNNDDDKYSMNFNNYSNKKQDK